MNINTDLMRIANEDDVLDLKAYQDDMESIVIFIDGSEVVVPIRMIFDDKEGDPIRVKEVQDPNGEGMELYKLNRDYEDRMEQERTQQVATPIINEVTYSGEEEVQPIVKV